jgi:galactokinase
VIDVHKLPDAFYQEYGRTPRIFSAPGRVNLIGEHTDYNQGFVLPIAIDRRTFVAAAKNNSRQVRVHALDVNDHAAFSLDDRSCCFDQRWLGYIAGVALELESGGVELAGADLMITSAVPIGAGLSSSAALEVATATALLAIAGKQLDVNSLALTAQAAEHNYVGTQCGIMDQLTVTTAKQDHALLIDCRSLQVTHVPLGLPQTLLLICNTNVKHELASSAYNQRRKECESAVAILRKRLPEIKALRDVTAEDLDKYQADLTDLLWRRAHHVVTENERTVKAAAALNQNDVATLGRLMAASHASLRNDYEVSCPELDLMVELAEQFDGGVMGARMTGGGFGGCTVNLVQADKASLFMEFIAREYRARTEIKPDIYAVKADRGVAEQ